MTIFLYRFIDGKEYLQEADEWELVRYETVNGRKEISIVMEYVFWKNGVDVLRVPALFMEKIEELEDLREECSLGAVET